MSMQQMRPYPVVRRLVRDLLHLSRAAVRLSTVWMRATATTTASRAATTIATVAAPSGSASDAELRLWRKPVRHTRPM